MIHDNNHWNRLLFDGGDYSYIIDDVFKDDELTVDENGIYTYKQPKKEYKGYYGLCWLGSNGFSELAYVWIIPEEFEFISYDVNRDGEWVKVATLCLFLEIM
ncbi:MAG: hypothetical protein IPJ74_14645 [Saprospiraceae bacterium]|nr:hypothetical protein [Saprospiraceae bacterium]